MATKLVAAPAVQKNNSDLIAYRSETRMNASQPGSAIMLTIPKEYAKKKMKKIGWTNMSNILGRMVRKIKLMGVTTHATATVAT